MKRLRIYQCHFHFLGLPATTVVIAQLGGQFQTARTATDHNNSMHVELSLAWGMSTHRSSENTGWCIHQIASNLRASSSIQ